jgi:uncharacterized membrane protein
MTMKKILGFILILAGITGSIAIILTLIELMIAIVLFCPLTNCIPQFFITILIAIVAITICTLVIIKGGKLMQTKKSKV